MHVVKVERKAWSRVVEHGGDLDSGSEGRLLSSKGSTNEDNAAAKPWLSLCSGAAEHRCTCSLLLSIGGKEEMMLRIADLQRQNHARFPSPCARCMSRLGGQLGPLFVTQMHALTD